MEQERRCEALTTKGRRCRKKAELYRQHQGQEYLTCKQHNPDFRPHPGTVKEKGATHEGQ